MNIPFIIGIGIIIFGIYFLQYALQRYRKALESQQWPSVQGVLHKVHLWGKRLVEYSVQKKRYTGTSITFYTLMYPETFNFAHDHPENSEVEVFYNPSNPSESVLIPGLRKVKPYSDLVIAVFALIIGVALAILAWFGVIG